MRTAWWMPRVCHTGMEIMAGAGLAMSAIGTVTSAGAQKQQGDAQAGAARIQAQAARENAEFQAAGLEIQAQGAEYDAEGRATIDLFRGKLADYSAEVGELRARRYESEAEAQADIIRRATSRAMGRTEAAYAASGVVTTTGTPITVMADLATEGELQAKLTIYGGDVQAADARAQSILDTAQGDIYEAIAQQERGVGAFQAASFRASKAAVLNAGRYGFAAGNAGADAIQAAGNTAAGTTLLTGLGRTALGAYNLFGTNTGGGGASGPSPMTSFAAGTVGSQPVTF